MDTETHRPRDEPENREIHEQFPADAAHERKGLAGEDEVPNAESGAPAEHRGSPHDQKPPADPEHGARPGQR